MFKEMNRREFLKTSAATGAVLMAGDVLKGGATVAYGSVKIPEVEKLVITVITDNYYDVLRTHEKIARRKTVAVPGVTLHAEHGLAYYIETVVNGKTYTFMFDSGWDFNGVSRNIELLDLDLRKLDALVLSHGHLDHFGNLIQILKYNRVKEFHSISEKKLMLEGMPICLRINMIQAVSPILGSSTGKRLRV